MERSEVNKNFFIGSQLYDFWLGKQKEKKRKKKQKMGVSDIIAGGTENMSPKVIFFVLALWIFANGLIVWHAAKTAEEFGCLHGDAATDIPRMKNWAGYGGIGLGALLMIIAFLAFANK